MGKAKVAKPSLTGPQKAMHSRVSYLYQAATYLATQQQPSSERAEDASADTHSPPQHPQAPNVPQKVMSRQIVNQLRSIVLKAQLRPTPEVKHSICKNCDTLLLEGSTCVTTVENKSRNGRKPWADVLLRRCMVCEKEARTPLAAQRQKRKTLRLPEDATKVTP